MDQILQGMEHVTCYIDDVLITGVSEEEHLQNLTEVLRRLCEHGVRLGRDKCHYMQDSVEPNACKVSQSVVSAFS